MHCHSSVLPIATHSVFEARFEVPLIETMGLTETSAQILSNLLSPGVRKIGSSGRAYGNEVRIVKGGENVAPREIDQRLYGRSDLIELCKTQLGTFKSPDRVHFLAELPKGPSGKIQRIKLAEIL